MRRAGRPVIPARRPATAAAALCAAVAAVTVLSGTGLNGAPLTGTAQASTAPTSAAPASTAPTGPAGAQPIPVGGPQLAGRGVVVNYPARGGRRLPHVPASAYVIADAGTGQVLAAKDPHGWYRPASTLKVLTAISLIPALNPNAMVVASKQATTVSPNIVGLLPGHSYKVSDLFTALLTISANDTSMALAQATGSLSQGMTVINAEARHLQADDTVAVTPNGLDAPGQHTSAYDLALFARQGLQMPAFLKYDQTTSAQFRISKKKSVGLWNQNSLLATYPGALGGKIGWTGAAGATYVGMARRHGRPSRPSGPTGPSRWAPALRCWPRPGSAAWRCSPRVSASLTAADGHARERQASQPAGLSRPMCSRTAVMVCPATSCARAAPSARIRSSPASSARIRSVFSLIGAKVATTRSAKSFLNPP